LFISLKSEDGTIRSEILHKNEVKKAMKG